MASIQSLEPEVVFLNAGGMFTMEGRTELDRRLTAMAVRDGRIVALGTDDSVTQIAGSVSSIGLNGAVVMPGLIDCHNHFLRTALDRNRVQLDSARSIDDLLEVIARRAQSAQPGEWILCSSRWHETNLAERRMPTAAELDQAVPGNPVYLPRGGHVVVTNSLGLQQAGIDDDSANPPGGTFVRNADGELTGMLVEMPAFGKVTRRLPQVDEEDRRRALRECIRLHNQSGITTVRDPGLGAVDIRSYQAVFPEEKSLRASLMWRVDLDAGPDAQRDWIDGLAPVSGFGDEWLSIWGLKLVIDGSVEGGYFREPYLNDPGFHGHPLTSKENLEAVLVQACRLDWRVGIHVVGDAAMLMALDAFEAADGRAPVGAKGHTLEHAFSPVPGVMDRARDAGIAITLQHALVYSLAGNMKTYWGDRRTADCSPSRAWLDSGALVGAGTDSPVTDYDPWLNVYGFATRDTQSAGVVGREHRISVAEALRAYTAGSAAILGQSRLLGSLEVGKAADFICLDRDPLSSSPEQVRDMVVTRTVVGGRQVFPG